ADASRPTPATPVTAICRCRRRFGASCCIGRPTVYGGEPMSRRLVVVRWSTFLLAGSLALAPSGCARNPVTGKNELSLVSESQEIEMGKQSAQQVEQTIGYYNDPGVQAYVSQIGLKMAKASERPNLPWEFHVVNDASV